MHDVSGKTIREYREWLRISQRDFSANLGFTQGLISQMELFHGPVAMKLLRRFCELSVDGAC